MLLRGGRPKNPSRIRHLKTVPLFVSSYQRSETENSMRFKQEDNSSLIIVLNDFNVNRAIHPLNAAPIARAHLLNAETAREIACPLVTLLQFDNAKTK